MVFYCDSGVRSVSRFKDFQKNSLTTEQGIIFVEQGILAQEQRIFPAKTKIIAG